MATKTINPHPSIQQEEFWECVCVRMPRGYYVLVDASDFPLIADYSWHASGDGETIVYANTWSYRSGIRRPLRMHRLIMNPPDNLVVDHKNGNTLDNRRSNLRVCTSRENNLNLPGKPNTSSQFKGVKWRAERGTWIATIYVDGRTQYLGSTRDERAAAKLYNEAAKLHFGEFAWLSPV